MIRLRCAWIEDSHRLLLLTTCFQFSLVDPDGKEGFPGEVIAYVTCKH